MIKRVDVTEVTISEDLLMDGSYGKIDYVFPRGTRGYAAIWVFDGEIRRVHVGGENVLFAEECKPATGELREYVVGRLVALAPFAAVTP